MRVSRNCTSTLQLGPSLPPVTSTYFPSVNLTFVEGYFSQMKMSKQLGVPMAERSKTLKLGLLEIAQVRILSVTFALFISTIDLVLYQLSTLFCLIRSSHRPVAHEDGQSKA
ncbi:hypothetical protein J6590_066997 [Homalodisca vitripennis]|nr:hypothetical protein J6590_066997 [Homalodisca vitripennis]